MIKVTLSVILTEDKDEEILESIEDLKKTAL